MFTPKILICFQYRDDMKVATIASTCCAGYVIHSVLVQPLAL